MYRNRIILHIDFDSFFASVEQQRNPLLRGKPIGVTATNGKTCIIASSKEAKVLGIKTGDRTYHAKRICPSIIFVVADFVKYFEVSKKFLNICKDYSPFVELFSIDEVFMDITQTEHLFRYRHSGEPAERSTPESLRTHYGVRRFWTPACHAGIAGRSQNDGMCGTYDVISSIKNRIREEIGEYITASIGISYNKLLAKLASGINKPNGVFEIGENNVYEVYKKAELTDVCGIGERIKIRLNKIGIYTLLDLRAASLAILIAEFGNAEGHFLKSIGLALDESPVVPYVMAPEVKSVSRNYCLPKNEYDKRVVLQNLFELCEEVGIKLRRLNKKARTVGVSLRGNINTGGRETYSVYMDGGKEIFRACLSIIRNDAEEMGYVRQISVWVSNLENRGSIQQSLFDSARQSSLQETIDRINEKFGDHTIRSAFLLYSNKLTTVPNGYMADKYERVKLAQIDVGVK